MQKVRFLLDSTQEEFLWAYLAKKNNNYEVKIIPKKIKKSGFFEKLFHVFKKLMGNLQEINCKEIFKKAYENRYTWKDNFHGCLLYTSPSPRDQRGSGLAASG